MKTFDDYLQKVQYTEGISNIFSGVYDKIKQFLRGDRRTKELINLVINDPSFNALSEKIFNGKGIYVNDKVAIELYNTWKSLREKAIANALSTGNWTEKEKNDMIHYLNWLNENAEGFIINSKRKGQPNENILSDPWDADVIREKQAFRAKARHERNK